MLLAVPLPNKTFGTAFDSFDRFRTSLRAPSIPDVGPPGVPLGDGRSLRRPESCSLCYAGSWLGSSEQFDGFGTDPGSRGGCALFFFFFLRGHGWCRCKYSSNSWLSDHLCVCVDANSETDLQKLSSQHGIFHEHLLGNGYGGYWVCGFRRRISKASFLWPVASPSRWSDKSTPLLPHPTCSHLTLFPCQGVRAVAPRATRATPARALGALDVLT